MRPALTLAALLFLALPSGAADLPVKIVAVHVGLPPGGRAAERDAAGPASDVRRFGSWAPVFVELEVTTPVNEPAELVIEAPDPDEVTTTLAVPLDLAGVTGAVSAADRGTVGYLRPAGDGEVVVSVRTRDARPLSEPFRVRSLRPRDPLIYVVLFLGDNPAGFDLPKPPGSADPSGALRGGRVELATITDPRRLPDQWFGYETADLVVLSTGNGDFLRQLFGEAAAAADRVRRAALLEWVRRGGRLVVSVGDNAPLVSRLPALRELLPVDVSGNRTPRLLPLYWRGPGGTTSGTLGGKTPFPVATLAPRPDRPARVLIPPPDRRGEAQEVVVAQATFGLGRVTVVGFDLDRAPFTDFPQRAEFWDWVVREAGANRASVGNEKARPGPAAAISEDEDQAAVALRNHADTFDGVPVVSFGWIALLIVLYILLIGPLEYFFLKRVLGRLELTWVTFPLIVLTVSLAAYFSAYALKGRDLKVNKIDVLDIDPASGRVYGTTWFTVFSPRIDTYTVGVSPGDGWGVVAEPGTAVSWVGSPRGGRASLLRRRYAYHASDDSRAGGLLDVPVQVWSTKAFVAHWSGRFDPASVTAPVRSHLQHPPGDPSAVIGTFVNRMPVPVLFDCVAFYAGQAYPLPGGGTVRSGETVRLVLNNGSPANQWLQREARLDELLRLGTVSPVGPGGRPGGGAGAGVGAGAGGGPRPAAGLPAGPHAAPAPDRALPLLGVLFHETSLTNAEGVFPRNASLRRLDQSWRLTAENRAEVILVGRAAPPVGPAEETLNGPNAASRLWLRGLPGTDRTPIPIPGTGRQETWVRVYLPVK